MASIIFQILFLCCDAAAVVYLFGVLSKHAGINWHGAPSLRKLAGGLLAVIVGSVVLRFVGFPVLGMILAGMPIFLGVVCVGFVFLVSVGSSWK